MTREEMVLWLYSILKVQAVNYKGEEKDLEELKEKKEPFKAVARVDLRELARYSVGEENTPKKIYDLFNYYRKVLKGLIQKVVFEVDKEKYKQALIYYGFDYLVDLYNLNRQELKEIALAVVEKIELWDNGVVVYFSEYVAPLIVAYKKWFTIYKLNEIIELRSRTALILYRLFRKQLGLQKKTFRLSAEELKEILDSSIETKDLRSKLIEPAIKEINSKTTLIVEVKPIRRGRGGKIVAFEFSVEEKPTVLTAELLLKNKALLKEWLSEILKKLVELLKKEGENLSIEELAQALLSYGRIDKATALWFLLHFTESSLLSAWKILKEVEANTDIRHKERFLKSVLPTKKKEFNFLLDPRVKPLLEKELKEIAGIKERKVEPVSEEEQLKEKIKEYWNELTEQGKRALLENFDAKDLQELLKENPRKVWGALKVVYRIHSL